MRLLMVTLFALGVVGSCLCQDRDRLIIPNWSMEEVNHHGPARWTWYSAEGGEGEFGWADVAFEGERSFRVAKIGSGGFTALVSDFVDVTPGQTLHVTARVYPFHNVRRGVYLMISQHTADSDDQQLPNAFGTVNVPLQRERWQEVTAQVQVREGNTRIRVHCLQAFAPCAVAWDAVEIGLPAPQAEPRYEPPVPEDLPPLEPARALVARRDRAQVEVRTDEVRPRLFVDGRPVTWTFYVGPFWTPQNAHIADFRDAGVRVYLMPLVLGRDVYGERGPWLGPGRYDFAEVDELLWRVLRVDPEGYIIFYMACDAYRQWGDEHPDDVTRDQNGLPAIVEMHPKRWGGEPPTGRERYGPSLVSPTLRAETAETLRRLVAHVESSEAGKAVIGYHVAGYNDGQWFQWASVDPNNLHLADYCPAAIASFRDWLRRRYHDDETALRRAWGRDDVSFESAEPPAFERYWANGSLLNAATDGDIADWTRFYSEGPAETVMFLADVIKQASGRRVLCSTYWEDITCNSANHIALGRFLADDALDFFAGPAAYGIRMAGYQGAVRSVFGSTLLHGRTFLTEQDWRSWRSVPDDPERNFAWGRAETAETHNAMVRRECGMMLAFGLGTWWYDMSGGWFADEGIMAGIAEAVRAFERDLSIPGLPRADLAVIVSEDSNHWVAPPAGGIFRYQGIVSQIHELNVSGVPYRVYLQSDLPDLPDHRAYLFLNPYCISDAERAAIERLKSDGHTLVFIHAPGAIGAPNPAATISAITGISVRPLPEQTNLNVVGIAGDHPLQAEPDAGLALPGAIRAPAFEVVGEDVVPLATFQDGGAVAAAAADFGDWRSVYVCPPCLTAEFANKLARWAGCWVAADPGNAVYANEHFLTVHGIFSGSQTFTLAAPARVMDLATGEIVAECASQIELDIERAQTRWFFLEPAH
ncbi:MAG: beta-galactosidase [Armatimonadota bacterium]